MLVFQLRQSVLLKRVILIGIWAEWEKQWRVVQLIARVLFHNWRPGLFNYRKNSKRFSCGAPQVQINVIHTVWNSSNFGSLSSFDLFCCCCFVVVFFNPEPVKPNVMSVLCHILLDAFLVFQPPALLRIYDLLS